MRITCIQMDVAFARPEENFRQAEALVRQAAKEERPDVILLPELWNTGFFPKEGLDELADPDGQRTAALCGGLARELGVNLVAGSVACLRAGKRYNTAMASTGRVAWWAPMTRPTCSPPWRRTYISRRGTIWRSFPWTIPSAAF